MLHYYIYYRVDPRFEADAATAVKQVQFEVEAETHIVGRLLKKRDEPLLWMEVYEDVTAGEAFEAILNRTLEKAGFSRYLKPGSGRKTECFQG